MKKRSINYLVPKLMVFGIPAAIILVPMVGLGGAMAIWAGVSFAFLLQNKAERKKEKAAELAALESDAGTFTGIPIMPAAETNRRHIDLGPACMHCGRGAT